MLDTTIEGNIESSMRASERMRADTKKVHEATVAMLDEHLADLPPDGRASKELQELRAEIVEWFEKNVAERPPSVQPDASGINPAGVEAAGVSKSPTASVVR